jgi:hypothetical protein
MSFWCCCGGGGSNQCNYTSWPDELYLTTGGKTTTLTKTYTGGVFTYMWRGENTYDFDSKTSTCLDSVGYPSIRFQVFCNPILQIIQVLYYVGYVYCDSVLYFRNTQLDWGFGITSGITLTSFTNDPMSLTATWSMAEYSGLTMPLGTGTVTISE